MTRLLVVVNLLLFLVVVGSGEVIAQTRMANASAHRAVSGMASACPAAATERGR